MFKDPIKILINFIAVCALVGYFGSIVFLGLPAAQKGSNPDSLKYISGIVTAVGASLATFFGAAVGINQIKNNTPNGTKLTLFQIIAAYSYFLSLMLAFGLWAYDGFSSTMPEAVSSLAVSLPGVMAGILAVALSLNTQAKPPDGNPPA